MNLKEAFRFQNKLGTLMDEAQGTDTVSLIDPRKTAYPPVRSILHPNAQPHVSINF